MTVEIKTLSAKTHEMGLTFVAIRSSTPCGLIGGGLRPEVFVDFAIAVLVQRGALPTHLKLWGDINRQPNNNTKRRRTENLGFKNKVTSCRLEKCMSSGRVWSLCFSLALLFLPLELFPDEYFGRVIPAPRVTGAKRSFAISFRSFSAGDTKSILNASFFSRLGLEAAAASVTSAAQQSEVSVSDYYRKEKKNRRLRTALRSFQCSGPAQFLRSD